MSNLFHPVKKNRLDSGKSLKLTSFLTSSRTYIHPGSVHLAHPPCHTCTTVVHRHIHLQLYKKQTPLFCPHCFISPFSYLIFYTFFPRKINTCIFCCICGVWLVAAACCELGGPIPGGRIGGRSWDKTDGGRKGGGGSRPWCMLVGNPAPAAAVDEAGRPSG